MIMIVKLCYIFSIVKIVDSEISVTVIPEAREARPLSLSESAIRVRRSQIPGGTTVTTPAS